MRFDGRTQGLTLALALAIAIGCGVIAGLLGRGHYSGRYAVPAQGSEPRAVAPPPAAPIVVPPPVAPPPATVAPPPPADTVDDDDADDAGRIADAIGRATQKALDRGEPVHWHKAGQNGYVVVSEPQDYPGRTCRTVSATILDEDDRETRSAPHLWCQNDEDEDGDWTPVR